MRKMMMAMTALALSSGVAWGQGTATQTVSLTASVGGHCSIDPSGPIPSPVSGTLATTSFPSSRAELNTNIPIVGTIASIICTSKVAISVSSANIGMKTGDGISAGNFVKKIHYTAKATYDTASVTLDTETGASTPGGTASAGPHTGVIGLELKTKATAAGLFLVDGTYLDTLTVIISPTS